MDRINEQKLTNCVPGFSGQLQAAAREDIQNLMHAGARAFLHYEETPTAADLAQLGLGPGETDSYPSGYYGPFGLYRYAIDHRGYATILFSTDPDHMNPQRQPEWIRRYPGNPYPGAYLERGDLTHVFAVGARQRRSRSPWEREEVASHEKSWWDNLLNAGTLFRTSVTRWSSSHFLYEMTPLRHKTRDRLRPELKGTDEQLYAVNLLTTTWHRQIPYGHRINMMLTRFLSLGPPTAFMTMAEAEKNIPEDFFHRSRLVVKGIDPCTKGVLTGTPDPESAGLLRSWLRAGILRARRKVEDIFIVPDFSPRHSYWKTQLMKTAASAGLKAAIRMNPAMVVREFLLGMVDKIFGKAIGHTTRPSEKEFVDEFLRPGRIKYVLDHKSYGKIDQEKGAYMRLLTRREARTDNFILAEQGAPASLPADGKSARRQWALDYILSTAKAPFGSEAMLVEKEGRSMLAINQANGLRVLYLPDLSCAYACLDPSISRRESVPLPAPVDGLLREGAFIKVCDKGGGVLHSQTFATAQALSADIAALPLMIPLATAQQEIQEDLPAAPDFIRHKPDRHDPKTSYDRPRPAPVFSFYHPWQSRPGSLLDIWRKMEKDGQRHAPISSAIGKIDEARDVVGIVQKLVVN